MQRTELATLVALRGDRRCKLPPLQRAIITLVHLREHTTYAKFAAGSRIGEGTVSDTGPAPRTFPSMSW
ncbi:transposase family protein [Streptomyces bacillaris]|uniref:transposase family protein n=1 Tax=Streptomyces bacillaris TaxID=68179 RepID=UPI000FD7141D